MDFKRECERRMEARIKMKMFFCGIDFVSLLFVSNTFVLDYFWEKPGTLLLNTSHKLPAYSMYICLLLSWHK